MKISKFQLKNGLNVILTESHKSPVISVQMWVRTGSADEKKTEEGISHFIEHLVFKGTRKFKVGEIAATIEGAGGELNAYTSFDQTVFYVTISKHFADTGLLAIAEMMGFPTFDPKEIDNEREVVIEEIKRGKDSLGRQASELLFSTNYIKHPYGVPVIGFDSNIKSMSAKKIAKFYHSRYAPKNMFLTVSGDFSGKEMQKKISKLFGEFKSYKIKKVTRTKEPKQTKPRVKVEKSEFEQSLGYVSWKIPSVKHKDVPALDVLALIMGQGDSSRLVQKLRIQAATVNSVGSSTYTPIDEGLFTISFGYNKEKLQATLSGITEVLQEMLSKPASEVEIKKAVLNLESEEFYSVETVDGLSRKMGSLEFYFKDLKAQEKYIKAIRKLTATDLLKVAKKYLIEPTLTVCIVTNDEETTATKVATKWVEDFKQVLKNSKIQKFKNKKINHGKIAATAHKLEKTVTEKIKLKDGTVVLLRPSRDTQVISVKAAYLGGLRVEPEKSEGLTELLSRTWTCGTTKRTEEQISKEIEEMASGVGPIAGRNSIGLGMDLISSFQEKGADLFLDILTDPIFSKEVIEREKLVQLEQIKSRNDNPAQSCSRLFMKNMFSGHPYEKDMMGSEESLRNVQQNQMKDYWNKVSSKKNLTLVLTGNFKSDLWLKKIENILSPLPIGQSLGAKITLPEIKNDIKVFETAKKEQSHVIYGYRGLSLTSEERYVLQIIQSVLAGQGGRLFLELRDKNSLAYSVSPMRMEGIETGYFGAYIGCSPEKVKKALAMMKEQFDLLCTTAVAEQELTRAKRYLVGRHDIDLQRTSAIAAGILYNDIYGIDFNEVFSCADKYFSVTPDDVMKLSKKIFTQKSVISVVGPTNPF